METHKGGCVVSVLMAEESGDKPLFPGRRHVLGKEREAGNSLLDHSMGEEVHCSTYLLACEWNNTLLGECECETERSSAVPRRNGRECIQGGGCTMEESRVSPEDSHVHVPLIFVGRPHVQREKQLDEGEDLFG